ncbi:MAG: arginine--tRNA ligase [Patescibacteria group bacterium]
MIEEKIQNLVKKALNELSIVAQHVPLEHPDEISHGDFSTNIALVHAKTLKMKPRDLAEKILAELEKNKPKEVERLEIAGPGFINLYLSPEFFRKEVSVVLKDGENFGQDSALKGKTMLFEYTDPNPFKPFHIGHLMSNAIGESLSRLSQFQGAKVVRACYQGDVGLHVAKAIYGMTRLPEKADYVGYLGEAYAFGNKEYEDDPGAKHEIDALNKKIFEKSDSKIQALYDKGRAESLKHFEFLYKKLGTKFDHYFFESEVAPVGLEIVKDYVTQNVFEVSEGAVVFRGDKHGLHTRVFISSQGLPTYETKELGLTKRKFKEINPDLSIVVTANEQSEYFKVVLEAMRHIHTKMAERTRHVAHGMLRFAEGKMSSRKGNVITGESLISSVEAMVHQKLEARELETFEKNKIAEAVAIGAIKYSILRQAIGSDIIYDFEKSISFEGDSGPYLQYSYVRAHSILEKAKQEGIKPTPAAAAGAQVEISLLERLLPRFPEVVKRAGDEYSPHFVATYLIELSGAFNSYYAKNKIVDATDSNSPYKVALTSAFAIVMKNGLWLLGIDAPNKM